MVGKGKANLLGAETNSCVAQLSWGILRAALGVMHCAGMKGSLVEGKGSDGSNDASLGALDLEPRGRPWRDMYGHV